MQTVRYESIESGLYQAREWVRDILEKAASPLARLLARMNVTPNQVSAAGFVLNVGAGGLHHWQ